MSTSFAALSTDHVNTDIQAFLHMFGVADHVHVEDAGLVEALDDMLGGNPDGRDEELGSAINDDAHEFVKFAFGVVVASGLDVSIGLDVVRSQDLTDLVFLALPPTCGINRSTPKGAFLSCRKLLSSAICSRSISGV